MRRADSFHRPHGLHVKLDLNTPSQPVRANPSLANELPESDCTDCKLRQLSRAVSRHFDENLRAHGLRSSQYSLLAYINEDGSSQLNHLAKRMRVEASTISRTVFTLVESGFVEIVQGKNRRTTAVRLTEVGERTLEAARPSWDAANKKLSQKMGSDSYQLLNSLLDESLKLFESEEDH